MPTTVLSPATTTLPDTLSTFIVETSRNWPTVPPTSEAEWLLEPEIEVIRVSAATGGHDLATAELRRRYGRVKHVHVPPAALGSPRVIPEVDPIDRGNWWVRLSLEGTDGNVIVWTGRISSQARTIHGGDVENQTGNPIINTGVQSWIAYGPMQILRKVGISESDWLADGSQVRLGWIPSMNLRDDTGQVTGNQTALPQSNFAGDAFLYGENDEWTRLDYVEYVLRRFVMQPNGPTWTIGGEIGVLQQDNDFVQFSEVETAESIIRKLADPRMGIDYKIVPTEEGFEIFFYTMTSTEISFAGQTMPKNPNAVRVENSGGVDMIGINVVLTGDQEYDTIRVIGKRIVVCCTLRGELKAAVTGGDAEFTPKWLAAAETTYKAGTGISGDGGDQHDEARRAASLESVYRAFGAPPDWTHNEGTAAPFLDDNGNLENGVVATHQLKIRRTLNWIPFREGFDYSQLVNGEYPNNNEADQEADFRKPFVLVVVPPDSENTATVGSHILGKDAIPHAVKGSGAAKDWGMTLATNPAHLVALNHFSGAAITEVDPAYDYENMQATIAFESDHRLQLEYQVPVPGIPNGSVKIIHDSNAEFWYAAPNTIVGASDTGGAAFLANSFENGVVLRNDASRLAMRMAGAISTYFYARGRAEIIVKGLRPWGNMLGSILTAVEGRGGDTEVIESPITSVEWSVGPDPTTTIRAGFAR